MNREDGFQVETLPPLLPAPQRWLTVVDPLPGEALTSLLGRQADSWNSDIMTLLNKLRRFPLRILPDLDLVPAPDLVRGLAQWLTLPEADLWARTLQPVLHLLIPPLDLSKASDQGWKASHLRWILPAGWQLKPKPRNRVHGGIPYCPLCIRDQGNCYSPLAHRLAFTTTCTRHKILLLDRCPSCQKFTAPATIRLQPLEDAGTWGLRCRACKREDATATPSLEKAPPSLLWLQALLEKGLESGSVKVPQLGSFPIHQFLAGLRICLSAVNWLQEQGISLPPSRHAKAFSPTPRTPGKHDVRFENASLLSRVHRLKMVAWILEEPLNRWPLLQQLCTWPTSLPKSWRHPWEGLDELGHSIMRGPWGNPRARATSKTDLEMVQEFFRLVESLGIHPVRVQGMLGGITSRQYDRWKNRPSTRIPSDPARRMELFLRLWAGLGTLFRHEAAAREWLFQPKRISPFDGLAPIDALSGPGTLHKFEVMASMFSSAKDHAGVTSDSSEPDSPQE